MKRGYLKYKYLPKYDLASKQTDPANMQLGINANDQADDVNKQTSMQLSNGIQSNVSSLMNNLSLPKTAATFMPHTAATTSLLTPTLSSSLMPTFSSLSSLTPAAASSLFNVGLSSTTLNQVNNLAFKLGLQTGNKVLTNQALNNIGVQTGKVVGTNLAKEASKASLKNAFGSAAAVAGNVLNLGSAIYNGIALGKGLSGMNKNVKSTEDLQGSVSTFNDNINGIGYQGYGGIDTNAEIKYMKALDKQSTVNNTVSGFGTGAGIGGLVGSIFPGVGNLIGSGIGGLFGGLFGLLGSGHKKSDHENKLRRHIGQLQISNDGYNTQALSKARTKALQNEYYDNNGYSTGLYSADKGKDQNYNNKQDDTVKPYGKVWTPAGEQYGPINGRIGKGESQWDFINGQASYVDKGVKRADDQFTSAENGDHIYIAGNDIDMTNGISFADQAAKPAQEVEKTNKLINEIQNGRGNDKTKELNLKQANLYKEQLLQKGKEIMNRQEKQHKMLGLLQSRSYDDGKDWSSLINYGTTSLPYIFGLTTAVGQKNMYKKLPMHAESPYAINNYANVALDKLASLKYDPYNPINAVKDAYRQQLYNINNAGGMSPGQRMIQQAKLNSTYQRNIADTYDKANEINNDYKAQYAQAMLQEGDRDAAARQQANQIQQERIREASAQKLRGIESANQGILNSMSGFTKNLFNNYQQYKSEQYNNKMLNLYAKEAGVDLSGNTTPSSNSNGVQRQAAAVAAQKQAAEQQAKNEAYNRYANQVEADLYNLRRNPLGGIHAQTRKPQFNYTKYTKPLMQTLSDLYNTNIRQNQLLDLSKILPAGLVR